MLLFSLLLFLTTTTTLCKVDEKDANTSNKIENDHPKNILLTIDYFRHKKIFTTVISYGKLSQILMFSTLA